MGCSIYTSHTLNHLKELDLYKHFCHKTALKLHANSVLYAQILEGLTKRIIPRLLFPATSLQQRLTASRPILVTEYLQKEMQQMPTLDMH